MNATITAAKTPAKADRTDHHPRPPPRRPNSQPHSTARHPSMNTKPTGKGTERLLLSRPRHTMDEGHTTPAPPPSAAATNEPKSARKTRSGREHHSPTASTSTCGHPVILRPPGEGEATATAPWPRPHPPRQLSPAKAGEPHKSVSPGPEPQPSNSSQPAAEDTGTVGRWDGRIWRPASRNHAKVEDEKRRSRREEGDAVARSAAPGHDAHRRRPRPFAPPSGGRGLAASS